MKFPKLRRKQVHYVLWSKSEGRAIGEAHPTREAAELAMERHFHGQPVGQEGQRARQALGLEIFEVPSRG